MKGVINGGILFLVTGCLLLVGCREKTPLAMEFDMRFLVIDESGFMEALTGSNVVPNANVNIRSIEYGTEYSAVTDSTGVAIIFNMPVDRYDITVSRELSPEEVEQVTGSPNARLLSGQKISVIYDGSKEKDTIYVNISPLGSFVISEVYYSGAPEAGFYFHDQFTEIFNNTEDTLYLDGILIANADRGHAMNADYVHSRIVWQFPGQGTDYPVAPGEMKIIAQDGIDHRENAPLSIDLSNADFEYARPAQGDVDNPNVTNMIEILHDTRFDFNYSVFRDAIVIAEVDDVNALGFDADGNMLIPTEAVIDGVEWLDDLTDYSRKRLNAVIDAGATGGIPSYSGKSVERRRRGEEGGRITLKDNNNSAMDFNVLDSPLPWGIH